MNNIFDLPESYSHELTAAEMNAVHGGRRFLRMFYQKMTIGMSPQHSGNIIRINSTNNTDNNINVVRIVQE